MKTEKLKQLERRAAALADGRQLVTVTFSDGSRRKMQLADTIPLLQVNKSGMRIVNIIGDGGPGSGMLAELLRGLLGDMPEIRII